MNKQDFMTKVGDPAKFIFRGQCYDAGPGIPSRRRCVCCDHLIRQVFVLHDSLGHRYYFGSGCIDHFSKWNKPLHKKLKAARIWLRTWIKSKMNDTRQQRKLEALRVSESEYKLMKKQAAAKLKEYHQTTGKQWLPEHLYALQELLGKEKPRPTQFADRAEEFRKYLTV